jgi:hypothetical protein
MRVLGIVWMVFVLIWLCPVQSTTLLCAFHLLPSPYRNRDDSNLKNFAHAQKKDVSGKW